MNTNGWYIMRVGSHTSAAWYASKEEADRVCVQMNYRGGAVYRVVPA